MRWLLLALVLLGAPIAQAQEFNPPGLEQDSRGYADALIQRNPAGMTAQAKRQAEQRASDAEHKSDWVGAASALETRLSGGDVNGDLWERLAQAQLRRAPPDAPHAAQAAWLAYRSYQPGSDQIRPLQLMAEAFRDMNRLDWSVEALEAVLQREPDDQAARQALAAARQAAGILVRAVTTEPESDPPLACIAFTTPPARRNDLVPADWVQLKPGVPDASITRQGDKFCIAGLPLGATTQVTLRAGLPGEDGLKLNHDATLSIAMENRQPRLIFDSRLFLLPRNQPAKLSLASVNLSSVKLKILRLSERNLVPWTRDQQLGQALERWNFEGQQDNGKLVWQGGAAIPKWQPNVIAHTALPLPDVFSEPGAYMVLATPGDGTPDTDAAAVQVVLRTDLAPTVWRGTDGLTVQVRSYTDASPRAGVQLSLLSRSNDILAQATTDSEGLARFPAPLLAGSGPQAPHSLHGQVGNDLVTLDLTTAAFDLSDRGVEGLPHPGPLDAYAWTDRGIYRPGERVQIMALLRDAAGSPANIPAHILVRRPNGQTFLDKVPAPGPDASLYLPVDLSLSAPAGQWTVDVLGDPARPPIGSASFRVDAFVPDRMAVEAAPAGPIVPGTTYSLPITARFLYGAPAADLTGSATVHLVRSANPPAALAGFQVGLVGETFAPAAQEFTLEPTDAAGKTTLPIDLKTVPDSSSPIEAQIDIAVDDPSGRSSHADATIPVRPAAGFIGIKPGFDQSIDAGAEASFQIAAVDRDGRRAAMHARLRLVRERPDWRLVMNGSLARYETVYKDEPIDLASIDIPAQGAFRYARRLDFGRYRLEVLQSDGLAASSIRFRAGWVASDSPDTPDKVDVSTDRRAYQPGEPVKVRIAAPFAGKATVLALTDRVHSLQDIDVPAGETTVELPADAAWGPGAYIAVHVFRGGEQTKPARAIGLAWAGIDPALRTLKVTVAAPERITPRGKVSIPIRTEPGAWVALATVDEGILRLTKFVSPDPTNHFLGRRRLGLDIRDDWGRLIPVADGEATSLRQGGDEGGSALPEIPQKTVTLFTPPVQAGPDGTATIALDIPDFNGQVRLMAVGWSGNKVGAGSVDMIVRDPLIAEPLLPRFLAPGDEARMGVLLQNLDLPAGSGTVKVSVEGPLALEGDATLTAQLQPNDQVVRTIMLRGTGDGRGIIHLDVTGPAGFHVARETAILVRPSRPPVTLTAATELGPNAQTTATPALDRMIPGAATASASLGGAVRYDVPALVHALDDYPLFCLEQGSSKGLPLTLLPQGGGRAAQLQTALATVLDKQRYDGGFGLWSASGEAETWLSAYATEFLLRAKQAGAAVPDAAIRDALKFISDALDTDASDPAAVATRAYDLYVLAYGGQPRAGAARQMAKDIDSLPTPLAKAQVAAALALGNDRPRAEAAFRTALADGNRKYWDADRGSALRDQFAIAVLLRESRLLPDELKQLVAKLPGANLDPNQLNTQEMAWGGAAGAVLGRDQRPVRVSVDGSALPSGQSVTVPLTKPVAIRNLGDQSIWETVSTIGVPLDPPPAARQGMRVSRQFYTLSGQTLDLGNLKQNTVFILLIEGRADDGQDHRALMVQGLPAGWEIAGRLEAGKTAGMPWLGDLSETEAQPAADDRFAATIALTADKPSFRVAVRLRAVTPGDYEIPGALLSDMYRPAVFARQNTNRIKVLANE